MVVAAPKRYLNAICHPCVLIRYLNDFLQQFRALAWQFASYLRHLGASPACILPLHQPIYKRQIHLYYLYTFTQHAPSYLLATCLQSMYDLFFQSWGLWSRASFTIYKMGTAILSKRPSFYFKILTLRSTTFQFSICMLCQGFKSYECPMYHHIWIIRAKIHWFMMWCISKIFQNTLHNLTLKRTQHHFLQHIFTTQILPMYQKSREIQKN